MLTRLQLFLRISNPVKRPSPGGHAIVDGTHTFGIELEEICCPFMFAARCRAWAQGAFARQQGREYDRARCFVESAQPCRRGDKVMIMFGPQPGCTGSVSRLMKQRITRRDKARRARTSLPLHSPSTVD